MRKTFCPALAAGVLVLCLAPVRGRADVYRCVQDDGSVSFQQIPCSARSEPLQLDTRPSGWTALRPGELRLLEQTGRRPAERPARPPVRKTGPDANAKACWKARRQLRAVREHLHRGYKLSEGAGLRRRRDDYSDYLRRVCR